MAILGQGTVNVVFEYMRSWNDLKTFVTGNKNLPKIPIDFEVKTKDVEKMLSKIKLTENDKKAIQSYTNILQAMLKQYKDIANANEKINSLNVKHNEELRKTQGLLQQINNTEKSRASFNKEAVDNRVRESKLLSEIISKEEKATQETKKRLEVGLKITPPSNLQTNQKYYQPAGKPTPAPQNQDVVTSAQLYQLSYVASQVEAVTGLIGKLMFSSLNVQRQIERSLVITNSVAKGNSQSLGELYSLTTELGRVAPVSLEKISNSMYELASAGLNTKEIMEAMPQATKLAVGVGEDLDTVLSTLVATVNGFDKDFSDSTRILDIFAKSVANSMSTVEKLNVSFSRVAPFAQEAGVSLEETTTMLSLLYNRGLSASRAGTVLTNVMQNLSNFSDKSTEALRRNGLSTLDVDLKYKSFKDSMVALANANLNAADSYAIFGQRGKLIVSVFAQMQTKAKELQESSGGQITNVEALGKAYDELNEQILGAGSVNQFFQATTQTTDYVMNQFSNSIKEFQLNMAEATKVAFVQFLKVLTSILNKINDLIESGGMAKDVLVALTVALGTAGLIGTLVVVGARLKAVIGLIGLAKDSINLFGMTVNKMGGILTIASVAIGVAAAAMQHFTEKSMAQSKAVDTAKEALKGQIEALNELTTAQDASKDSLLESLNLTRDQDTAVKFLETRYHTHITTLGQLREAQEKFNNEKDRGLKIDSTLTGKEIIDQQNLVKNLEASKKKILSIMENTKGEKAAFQKATGIRLNDYDTAMSDLQKKKAAIKTKEASLGVSFDGTFKSGSSGDWAALNQEKQNVMYQEARINEFFTSRSVTLLQDSLDAINAELPMQKDILQNYLDYSSGKVKNIVGFKGTEETGGYTPSSGGNKNFDEGVLSDIISKVVNDKIGALTAEFSKEKLTEAQLKEKVHNALEGSASNITSSVIGYVKGNKDFDQGVVAQVLKNSNVSNLVTWAINASSAGKIPSGSKAEPTEQKTSAAIIDEKAMIEEARRQEMVGKAGKELIELKLKYIDEDIKALRNAGTETAYTDAKTKLKEASKGGTIKGKDISFGTGEAAEKASKNYQIMADNYSIAKKNAEDLAKLETDKLQLTYDLTQEASKYTAELYDQSNAVKEAIRQYELLNMSKSEQNKADKQLALGGIESIKQSLKVSDMSSIDSLWQSSQKALGETSAKGTISEKTGKLEFLTAEDEKAYNNAVSNAKVLDDYYKNYLNYKTRINQIDKEDGELSSSLVELERQKSKLAMSDFGGRQSDIDSLKATLKLEESKSDKEKDSLKIAQLQLDIDSKEIDLAKDKKDLNYSVSQTIIARGRLRLNERELDKAELRDLESLLQTEKDKTSEKQDQLKIAQLELEVDQKKQTIKDKKVSVGASMVAGLITGQSQKISNSSAIESGITDISKGNKGTGTALLAIGMLNQLSDNIMSERMASLDYEISALEIRKASAKTDEERKQISEEELALQKQKIQLQYESSTSYMGTSGATGGFLSGAVSGAVSGATIGGGVGAAIGAALGGLGGIFGASASKKQAEREAKMLQYQYEMTVYLQELNKNIEGNNTYLSTIVDQGSSIGLARARQEALNALANSSTGQVGGSATAAWNDRHWHGGWHRGWSDNWVNTTANYNAGSFGYKQSDLKDINNVQKLLAAVTAKQATVGGSSANYNVTEGSESQARANYLALEEMKKELQTILDAYTKLAPAIYQSYFGATLTAITDSTGLITSYTTSWTDQIGNILSDSWEETINGFSKSANLSVKTIFEGIMNATVQNSTKLNAIIDKIISLQEKISNALIYQQQGFAIDSESTTAMVTYFEQLVGLVNEQNAAQEELNATSKKYIEMYLNAGGNLIDIMDSMGDAANNIYTSIMNSLGSGNTGDLFSSLYQNFNTDFLQPFYEDILNSSSAVRDLMTGAMNGSFNSGDLDSITQLVDILNMTSDELSSNVDVIASTLGLSSEAIAQLISLKESEEALSAIADAYDLYNSTKDSIESALEDGFMEGINASGDYSKDALEASFGKTLKSIIFQNILDGVLTQSALQAKINYLSANMMDLSVAQLEVLMNSIISDADTIFEGLSPFIDSMNDLFDKYTGVNDKPIVFFDETNLDSASATAGLINDTLNGIISSSGGNALASIANTTSSLNSITATLDSIVSKVPSSIDTTSTKYIYLKIESDQDLSTLESSIAEQLKTKYGDIEILF